MLTSRAVEGKFAPRGNQLILEQVSIESQLLITNASLRVIFSFIQLIFFYLFVSFNICPHATALPLILLSKFEKKREDEVKNN
jgi:hypothetical protein